jgi:hypothetical protein
MQLPRAYQMEQVEQYDVTNTAVPIPINNRVFMIVNQGGQPLYIDPKNTATADSFMIPAGMAWPQFMSCDGDLSVISNATGTSVGILYLDV